jgi:hypothetical protein
MVERQRQAVKETTVVVLTFLIEVAAEVALVLSAEMQLLAKQVQRVVLVQR